MTYLEFLTNVETYVKQSMLNGVPLNWYSEICLEDEIELKTGTTYPAVFIVPIPFDVVDPYRINYSCKIYMVDGVTRAPNVKNISGYTQRILTFNRMVSYAQAFLQQLPGEYINEYPVTINPIVKWDANIDGIYFDFTLATNTGCL